MILHYISGDGVVGILFSLRLAPPVSLSPLGGWALLVGDVAILAAAAAH
ncbi:hypothetical protein [Mycobacterium uberis]|nr:hypothetical protein [Mycobacterium uberis]